MIYACDNCHYLFSAADCPTQCPDCGKVSIRPATPDEIHDLELREDIDLWQGSECTCLATVESAKKGTLTFVPGVKMRLTNENGESWVQETDSTGRLTFGKALTPGNYEVEIIQTPSGLTYQYGPSNIILLDGQTSAVYFLLASDN